MYICDHLKKKLCFYDDFKYNKKIIENRNFLRAKNVYLGVPGLTRAVLPENIVFLQLNACLTAIYPNTVFLIKIFIYNINNYKSADFFIWWNFCVLKLDGNAF